jgi:hypothetical protein
VVVAVSDAPGAKLYEPPVVCAKRGCAKRLTVAAVNGCSKHCSREHVPGLIQVPTAREVARDTDAASPEDRGSGTALGSDSRYQEVTT